MRPLLVLLFVASFVPSSARADDGGAPAASAPTTPTTPTTPTAPTAPTAKTVKPLPKANDLAAGQLATQCVFYYRLEPTDLPVDDRICERDGYGLDFMRAHWADVEEVEKKRAEAMAHARVESQKREWALAHKAELEAPCRDLAFDAGPGPDAGADMCRRAGWPDYYFTRKATRERILAEREHARLLPYVVGGALLVVIFAVTLIRVVRRRKM